VFLNLQLQYSSS